MSLFDKPVSQLTVADLSELLDDHAVENLRLEFKLEIPDKDETLKKITAFANTSGGLLVIGARAQSNDGRIAELPGVTIESGYKQRIVQWCFQGADPPIAVEVSDPIKLAESGKVAYVIAVPQSALAPHFINGRKGVYVRTDEYSQRFEARLANQPELAHLLNRRETVIERRGALLNRARQRFASLVETKYAALQGEGEAIGAQLLLSISPVYPTTPVWEMSQLRRVIGGKRLNWRQVGFPRSKYGVMSQHESVLVIRPGTDFSMLEANIWGQLFYATEIERRIDTINGIHLNSFLGHLVVFVEHARLVMDEMSLTGQLQIALTIEKVRGVPWLYFPNGNTAEQGPASELDNKATIDIETTTDEIQANRVEVLGRMLKLLFYATNWAEVAEDANQLQAMIKVGYEYNFWTPPQTN